MKCLTLQTFLRFPARPEAAAIVMLATLMVSAPLAVASGGAIRSFAIEQLHRKLEQQPALGEKMITLILSEKGKQNLDKAITTRGEKIVHRKNGLYQVRMPAKKVKAFLDKMPQGTSARFSFPHTTTLTSQGVSLTGATDMQNLAYDGAGVKIGVIDLGFANLAASQAANELPASLSIIDYSGTGTGGTNHGTSVAEIVHDMAPGADLYLAKVSTDLELQIAVDDMIANGIQVINHSVAWFGAAFYDGTGPICDITATADTAGIIWANAAGNSRKEHYLGTFTDANSNLFHEFSAGQDYNTIAVTAGQTYTLVLNWDDYAASKPEDYDLFVYDGDPNSGSSILASSTNPQFINYPWPYEDITFTPPASGTHYIVVKKRNASTADKPLTLFSLGESLGTGTKSSSLTQPADCSNVLAVGATNLSDSPEGFSSEGPTTDGRDKPEISGPDRVITSMSASFAGTSAASPHVAGAVAQLIQQNPGLNKSQIQALVIDTSHDVHSAGFDYRTGFGRFSLDADSDSINHDEDNCLLDYNPGQFDNDLDTAGDICDDDDDNDGLSDSFETSIGSNTFLWDTDGDGLSDYDEVAYDGDVNSYIPGQDLDPTSADTDGDSFSDSSDPIPLTFNFNDGDLAPLGAPDGIINTADFSVAISIALGSIISSELELSHADLYPQDAPDGVIDLSDLVLIKKLVH